MVDAGGFQLQIGRHLQEEGGFQSIPISIDLAQVAVKDEQVVLTVAGIIAQLIAVGQILVEMFGEEALNPGFRFALVL